MKEQLILLRKENDLLNSLIGQSFNQRTKFQAEKILTEIHSKAQDRSIGKMTLCYIVDKNEVLGVGGSTLLKDKNGKIISNLILDQFGIWLAGIFKGGLLSNTVVIKDETNTDRTLRIYSTGNTFQNKDSLRALFRVGSGTTAPIRTNLALETPFVTLPESSSIESSIPIFNSGLGNFKQVGSITAGGAGTINETILLVIWRDVVPADRVITLFRDIISPAQPFIVGQSIALEYTVQI